MAHIGDWRGVRVYRILERRPEEKRPLEGHRHRWEDNIEKDFQEVGWGDMGLTDLAHYRTGGRILRMC